jgi:hypothetical protein
MKREQGPRDEDAPESRIDVTDLDGPSEPERGGQLDSPDGAGGGSTTRSDI